MADDVLTRNSDDELALRVVQSSGDTGTNKEDVYTRDSQGRLAVRTVGGSGGGADYSADIEALNNAVSVLETSAELSTEIGGRTTVGLADLTAMDIDGRPSYKQAGATVYAENGVVGIIDSVDSTYAIITTVQYGAGAGTKSDNGIKGDYCATYGITDMPNGVIESVVGTNNLNIPAGIVLKAAGSDTLTTLASETVHQTTSTSDFTLFYVAGEMLECGDVVYSETEPLENGVDNYQAWFNPQLGKWQFRSNDTGNVWREAVATPLCDCYFSDSALTRIDFIGYRVLNKQTFGAGGDFLPLSGGTMTGVINFDFNSGPFDSENLITFTAYNGSLNVIKTGQGGSGLIIEIPTTSGGTGGRYQLAGTTFAPNDSGTKYLGSSLYRWGTVFATKFNNGADIDVPTTGGTMVVATPPTENGTYVLKATVVDGVITTEWVLES